MATCHAVSIFERVFGRKNAETLPESENAVRVFRKARGLPAHDYQECDLGSIGDR